MTDNEYLQAVLKSQDLADDSAELKALTARREDVEALLRRAFPDSSPTIRYGGSKAKGTLIKESYDLDIVCYFPHDDTTAGDTLEDIYNNVAAALEKDYAVERKRSASAAARQGISGRTSISMSCPAASPTIPRPTASCTRRTARSAG